MFGNVLKYKQKFDFGKGDLLSQHTEVGLTNTWHLEKIKFDSFSQVNTKYTEYLNENK
jgi:hypothetical protein